MQILLLTIGTRGDIQPCIALALGLQAAGHRVRFATYPSYAEFVTRYGLTFEPIEGDMRALTQGQKWQKAMMESNNPVKAFRFFLSEASTLFARAQADSWRAAQGVDAVLYYSTALWGYDIATRLDVPCCQLAIYPVTPTRVFPAIVLAGHSTPFNRISHFLLQALVWQVFRGSINTFRRQVLGMGPAPLTGIPPRELAGHIPVLYGYSAHVIPKPADWPDWTHVTGYWFLDQAEWQPPAALLEFLDAGPAPIYVGFGSMTDRDAERTGQIVREAVHLSGQRAVIASGWSQIKATDLSRDLFLLEEAPHTWLFPRMAAVVHHGGQGTVAASLRAGVPAVTVPHSADHPFWSYCVAQMGVGPQPIPRRQLTAKRLAEAITTAVTDPAMRARAATTGMRIRAEDGVRQAVDAFQHALN